MTDDRIISYNTFGDGVNIHQGDTVIHNHNSTPPHKACYVIPFPPNENIIRRPKIVAQLDRLLSPSTRGESCNAALWGLGGSGKTQIALDYAYRRSRDDPACAIFWVHADSETSFTRDYQTIARKLGLDHTLSGDKMLLTVRDCIESQARWLLILDNADDVARFGVGTTLDQTKNLLEYIPQNPRGAILWTSRDERIIDQAGPRRGIQIPHMTIDEAKRLLAMARNESIRDEETQDAQRLLQDLQWLPLAIFQAGSYMRRTSTSIKKYLRRLQEGESRRDILKETQHDRHRRPDVPNSVLETWNISIQHIQQESEMAYRILHTMAYLDNDNIPLSVILRISTFFDQAEQGNPSENEKKIKETVILRLKDFSFISARKTENDTDPSFDMHKLVQEAILYRLKKEHVTLETHSSEKYFSSTALRAIASLFPKETKREELPACEKYATHAIRVSDWAEMSEDVPTTYEFLTRVSDYFQHCEVMKKAEYMTKKALNVVKKASSEDSPKIIIPMSKLAEIYLCQERYEEAKRLASKALILAEKELGEKHIFLIGIKICLATIYRHQGHHSEAEELQVKILSSLQEFDGEDPRTIFAMTDLAKTYEHLERYDQARDLRIEALALYSKALGKRSPTTVEAMGSLAETYILTGQTKEAEELDVKILSLGREFPWEECIKKDDIHSLILLFSEKRMDGKARDIRKRILSLQLKHLGEKNVSTIRTMGSLAKAYTVSKEYKEAEELQAKALALYTEILGEQNDRTISSMAALSTVHYRQLSVEKGERLEVKAVSLLRETYGDEPPAWLQGEVEGIATERILAGMILLEKSAGNHVAWRVLEFLAHGLLTGWACQIFFILLLVGVLQLFEK